MKTNIIIKLQIEATHNWPGVVKEAGLENVHFLKDEHRHIFYITCKKEVVHADRQVEIIMFKRNILNYLRDRYFNEEKGYHVFGSMSCEMIATELFKIFDLSYCEVLEDNENGGIVEKETVPSLTHNQEPGKKLLLDHNDSITASKNRVTDFPKANGWDSITVTSTSGDIDIKYKLIKEQ